jgi:hypothetical protein
LIKPSPALRIGLQHLRCMGHFAPFGGRSPATHSLPMLKRWPPTRK